MTDNGRIVVSGAELVAVRDDARPAAASLEKASSALRSTIPSDAFGAFGSGVAASGNALGGALGVALEKLGRLVRETGDGAGRILVAFDEVEANGSAAFRRLAGQVDA